MKRVEFLFLICVLLVACRKSEPENTNITTAELNTEFMVETTAPTEPETSVKKSISEYPDCTVTIPDSFHEIADKPNLIPMTMAGCFSSGYDTIEKLYLVSSCVIKGKIVDLTYSEEGYHAGTFYSFAVEEVLAGEGIEPETVVSVLDSQGYVRLETYRSIMGASAYSEYSDAEVEKTYLVNTFGEPLVQIGEEYVLFIVGSGRIWDGEPVDGEYYIALTPYVGKFKLNKSGVYEQIVPEYEKEYFDLSKGISLEEIKEQLKEAEENKKGGVR